MPTLQQLVPNPEVLLGLAPEELAPIVLQVAKTNLQNGLISLDYVLHVVECNGIEATPINRTSDNASSMSAKGHYRIFRDANAMSALPPKADVQHCMFADGKLSISILTLDAVWFLLLAFSGEAKWQRNDRRKCGYRNSADSQFTRWKGCSIR